MLASRLHVLKRAFESDPTIAVVVWATFGTSKVFGTAIAFGLP